MIDCTCVAEDSHLSRRADVSSDGRRPIISPVRQLRVYSNDHLATVVRQLTAQLSRDDPAEEFKVFLATFFVFTCIYMYFFWHEFQLLFRHIFTFAVKYTTAGHRVYAPNNNNSNNNNDNNKLKFKKNNNKKDREGTVPTAIKT